MEAASRTGNRITRLVALAAGLGGTLFCIIVIYRTAQLPAGDGTGMQWVIVVPLAFLFFGLILPVLIYGINGFRPPRPAPSPEVLRRRETWVRRAVIAVIIFLVFVFGVMPLIALWFDQG